MSVQSAYAPLFQGTRCMFGGARSLLRIFLETGHVLPVTVAPYGQ